MSNKDNDINLLDSLIENKSIQINVDANDWKEAIEKSIIPLIKSKAVESRYLKAIIDSTIKFGPYYIISNQVAMPHARPEDGVNKSAFSLVILNKPIQFNNDKRKIRILITLAAASSEIHVSVSLPQVVASFESDAIIEKLLKASSDEEVIKILKKIDYSKYLN